MGRPFGGVDRSVARWDVVRSAVRSFGSFVRRSFLCRTFGRHSEGIVRRKEVDTKKLSPRQVRWAQELSQYHFRIDYRRGKSKQAADALSQPTQKEADKETLLLENEKDRPLSADVAGESFRLRTFTPLSDFQYSIYHAPSPYL